MMKLLVLLVSFLCEPGAYTFRVSWNLAPEQILLLKRSVDYINQAFGCKLVGLVVDSEMKNEYRPQDQGNTIMFLKDVSVEPGVGPNAIAFTDDVFAFPHQDASVHIAIDSSHSYPSSSLLINSNPKLWRSWDWSLVRVVLHEIGHSLGLHDDEVLAGPIMHGQEEDSDQSEISRAEMKAYVDSIKFKGAVCQ